MDDDWVQASEIGEYAYCARSYWLHRVVDAGAPADDAHAAQLAAGDTAHEAYAQRRIATAVARRRTLTAIGILLLLVAAVVVILTMM